MYIRANLRIMSFGLLTVYCRLTAGFFVSHIILRTEVICMIDVVNLSKSYGLVEALRNVSLSVKPGEIVGLLGPNGAGKTTLIKILTGYLQPNSGTATVDGLDVLTHTREVQARIGYLAENAPLYPELAVQAYLKMMADLRRIPEKEQIARISEAVYATAMPTSSTRPIGQLSKGFRQRVGLAQAILHKPKILILDEPTVGLDPTQIVEVRGLIRRLAEQSTMLFSTPYPFGGRGVVRSGDHPDERPGEGRRAAGRAGGDRGCGVGVGQQDRRASSAPADTRAACAASSRAALPMAIPSFRVLGMGDVDLCPAI